MCIHLVVAYCVRIFNNPNVVPTAIGNTLRTFCTNYSVGIVGFVRESKMRVPCSTSAPSPAVSPFAYFVLVSFRAFVSSETELLL
jgi:hypothetical protein